MRFFSYATAGTLLTDDFVQVKVKIKFRRSPGISKLDSSCCFIFTYLTVNGDFNKFMFLYFPKRCHTDTAVFRQSMGSWFFCPLDIMPIARKMFLSILFHQKKNSRVRFSFNADDKITILLEIKSWRVRPRIFSGTGERLYTSTWHCTYTISFRESAFHLPFMKEKLST